MSFPYRVTTIGRKGNCVNATYYRMDATECTVTEYYVAAVLEACNMLYAF